MHACLYTGLLVPGTNGKLRAKKAAPEAPSLARHLPP